jgi:DMSO/TMAO reductase YedYZ heme-binding membrane subunit
MKTFRAIHLLSLVAYLGAVIHGFFSGTDSSLLAAQLLYFSTFLVVLFMTLYWIMMAVRQKTEAPTTTSLHPSKTTKNPP